MKRIALFALVVLLLLPTSAGAQQTPQNASSLADCRPDESGFEDCLRNHTNKEDILNWIHEQPSNLTENQVSAVHVYNVSNLSGDVQSRVDSWTMWAAGGDMPDWFSGGTSTSGDQGTNADPSGASTVVNATDVEKYRQIREGQWLVSRPTWYDNGTGQLTIYSEYDGRIAIADNGDCAGSGQGFCSPDVTNQRVGAGTKTTIWFDASVMTGTFDNGDQAVTLNSMTNSDGQFELAVARLSNPEEPLFGDPLWDFVWIAVLTAVATLSALSLTVYAYIWWTSRRLEENGFRYLSERL